MVGVLVRDGSPEFVRLHNVRFAPGVRAMMADRAARQVML